MTVVIIQSNLFLQITVTRHVEYNAYAYYLSLKMEIFCKSLESLV